MFARLSAPLAALLVATHAAAGPAALPSSLHEAGGRPDRLYVVLFSLPDCPYCVAVRQAYLPALPDDPRFGERVRMVGLVGLGQPAPFGVIDQLVVRCGAPGADDY